MADHRQGEPHPLVVMDELQKLLDSRGLGEGACRVRSLGDGNSNYTFLVERHGWRGVLRRPPRPPYAPKAHDVLREAEILSALAPTAAPVPGLVATVEQSDIMDVPFVIMDLVDGHVVSTDVPQAWDGPAGRREVGSAAVDALVSIHSVDWRRSGLGHLGRPEGYLERQIRRFDAMWSELDQGDIPAMGSIKRWLDLNLPVSQDVALVHGDYRLGNIMLGSTPSGGVAAVLDWELSTLGDPLADLGYFLANWSDPDDAPAGVLDFAPVTRQPGFLRRADLVELYSARSGRPAESIRWYTVLAMWKSVVIGENVRARAASGASAPTLGDMGDAASRLADRATQMIAEQP